MTTDILIIGCGAAGSAIATQLAKGDIVNSIKLADFDAKRTKKVSSHIRHINKKIYLKSIEIDAKNRKNVEKSLTDVKIVINAASPTCNIPIMKACLSTGTQYIDLASDPYKYPDSVGTSIDEQLVFNNQFIKRDLLALTNAGFAPGFTDILCRYVVDKYSLDSIESFRVYFGDRIISKKPILSWSPYTILLENLYPPTIFRNGRIVEISSGKGSRDIVFPEPIGKIRVRISNGHPELRTIPDFLGTPIKYIEIGTGYLINGVELNDIISQRLGNQHIKSQFINEDYIKKLADYFDGPEKFLEYYRKGILENEFCCCLCDIHGKKDDKTLHYRVIVQHELKKVIKSYNSGSVASYIVSFVPAVLVEKVLNKEIAETGVIAPARLDNTSGIIEECRSRGLNFKEFAKWQR